MSARMLMAAMLLAGCVTSGGVERSILGEPPPRWESAVRFTLNDSTRNQGLNYAAELSFALDGRRVTIRPADEVPDEAGQWHTSWIRLERGVPLALHVELRHPGGHISSGTLLLTTARDWFYDVSVWAGVPDASTPAMIPSDARSFPLDPRAGTPGTLIIGWTARTRECFRCPN